MVRQRDDGGAGSAPAWMAQRAAYTAACVCAALGRPQPAPLPLPGAYAAVAAAKTPADVCLTAMRVPVGPPLGSSASCAASNRRLSSPRRGDAKLSGTSMTTAGLLSPAVSVSAPGAASAGGLISVWKAVGCSAAATAMSPGPCAATWPHEAILQLYMSSKS